MNSIPRVLTALLVALLVGCGGHSPMPIVHQSREFDSFMEARRAAAATPDPGKARRGQEVFLDGPCAMCHTVRGTAALSRVGPDLTHLASRRTIAAGTMANTRGNLAGWILNPQNLKPGTKMPPTLLDAADLHALLVFLETLQ